MTLRQPLRADMWPNRVQQFAQSRAADEARRPAHLKPVGRPLPEACLRTKLVGVLRMNHAGTKRLPLLARLQLAMKDCVS